MNFWTGAFESFHALLARDEDIGEDAINQWSKAIKLDVKKKLLAPAPAITEDQKEDVKADCEGATETSTTSSTIPEISMDKVVEKSAEPLGSVKRASHILGFISTAQAYIYSRVIAAVDSDMKLLKSNVWRYNKETAAEKSNKDCVSLIAVKPAQVFTLHFWGNVGLVRI